MDDKKYIVRNYQARIDFIPRGQDALEKIGSYLARVRNNDYVSLVTSKREDAEYSRKQRRLYGRENLLTTRLTDTIIGENNDQLDFVLRTTKENVKAWKKDIASYEKKLDNGVKGKKKDRIVKEVEKINSKINNAEKRSPSCCFGGKKLQRDITLHPEDTLKKNTWEKKRLFLQFDGATGRSLGNDHVKLLPSDKTNTYLVVISLPEDLSRMIGLEKMNREDQEKYGFKNKNYHVIGEVALKNKQGLKNIQYCLENNVSLSYEFVWSHAKQAWSLHVSTRINKEHIDSLNKKKIIKRIPGRVCGLDQNSGFVTATIIDKNGNPIVKKTFEHSSSKDMNSLSHEIVSWCEDHYCGDITIEDLTTLHSRKRRSNSSARGRNYVVNKIPYGEFKNRLSHACELKSMRLSTVFAGGTSSMTTQWKESRFGVTTHEKASYLIARRGLGLSLSRRDRHHNSVCGEGHLAQDIVHSHTITVCDYSHDSTSDSSACSVMIV